MTERASGWKRWTPVKANLHLPGLKEMVATSVLGECPFCGELQEQRTHPNFLCR